MVVNLTWPASGLRPAATPSLALRSGTRLTLRLAPFGVQPLCLASLSQVSTTVSGFSDTEVMP